jgi:very-short-patch-repair endonuclease
MEKEKEKLELLIEKYKSGNNLKLYSMIRKDRELLSWINEKVPVSDKLSEQIYCIMNNTNPICENGNKKTFKDSWLGYMMCGRSNVCKCWSENQSKKLSDAKKSLSKEEWDIVIEKRKKSNIEKYGVEHVSQTQEFKDKISEINVERYGVKTTLIETNTKEKIKETLVEKFGVDNPMKSSNIKNKAMDTCLEKYGHVVFPHSVDGRLQTNQTLKEKYNVASIAQLKYSQEVRDYIQDTKKFHDEYFKIGINGICDKYPELNYNMCRAKLLREGIEEVIKYTKPESFIKDFLDKNKINYQFNTRKIITPQELDFYIPSHNIAIEVCGLYWHRHSLLKDEKYHVKKLEKCLAQGIQLITIFSDKIEETPNLVLNRLSSKLKLIQRTHHARKLKIMYDTPKEKIRKFLNENHIQGTKLGSTNLTAIDEDNNIVSVMTFGELRTSLGQKNVVNTYEMYRFATNGNIPGIASKMFKYFINNYYPTQVISYSDRNWGEGEMYINLNFTKDTISRPNFWYTKDYIHKKHRFGFAKYKLVEKGYDTSLTAYKIMESLGYDRIYDCGSIKYVWNK